LLAGSLAAWLAYRIFGIVAKKVDQKILRALLPFNERNKYINLQTQTAFFIAKKQNQIQLALLIVKAS